MNEKDVEHQRSVLEAVVETVPDGILVVDDDRDFFTYNERFVEMWGIPDDIVETGSDQQALNSVLDELERPDDFRETVEYFYDNPDDRGRDLIHLSDGRIFDRYTAPATDEDGTYYGRIWVFEDITERKTHEQELRRQNERLEEFASIVSHDLRNPLSVANGRLELAREECDSEHLEYIARAHERMGALIDDLLTLTREGQTATELTTVDLAEFAEECWRNVTTADATLVTDTTRTIRADESRLRQVFENLVRNAVEHGGEDVTVTVGELADGFYVEDDGSGIPSADRDQVFEAGYSTRDEGTGFGLRIVEQVVGTHDWDITVTDGAAGGARFEFTGVDIHE